MSAWRRDRGPASRRPRTRLGRWIRRAVRLAVLCLVALVVGPALFIATQCYGSGSPPPPQPGPLDAHASAMREESYTFLTLPEWFIVYSTEEYAAFIARQAPSAFPYLGSVVQYWRAYDAVCEVTRPQYPFQTGYHVMLGVIGASFTAENVIKGVYENTIGRLTEWVATRDTPEDLWAARTAREYGAFLHTVPWYEFPFAQRLSQLWRETPRWGPHPVRKWERRLALTAEYGGKAVYGWLLGAATRGAYGAEDLTIYAIVSGPEAIFEDKAVVKVSQLGPETYVVTLPRYEAFTVAALALDGRGGRFVSVAGNDELMISALVPAASADVGGPSAIVATLPILTDPTRVRIALRTPIAALHDVLAAVRAGGGTIEHLYDY